MEAPHDFGFNSLTVPGGTFYRIKDAEGNVQVFTDMIKTKLQANGIEVTQGIENEINAYFRQQLEEYNQELISKGIPDKLKTIFDYTKKSKLVAYCERIKISEDELGLLIHNCAQIGYKHQSKFKEFVPENRKILDSDVSELKQGNPRKLSNKVKGIFEERKKYHVHLFEKDNEWHCFYFTYRDISEKNQFKLGSHLHYVSYLWTNYRKRQVWESFDKRVVDIKVKGVHIQLETSEINVQQCELQFPIDLINKFKQSNSHNE
jgi:ribosomal protein S18